MNLNATLLGEMITFAIFVWFTMKFVWPIITTAIADRQKTIADGLAAAAKGQKSLTDAQAQIDEQLQQAKTQASTIIDQADKRAAQLVDDAKVQAREEAERILAAAQTDIAREKEAAKQTLKARVAELAVMGAETILAAKIDTKNDAELLAKLSTEI